MSGQEASVGDMLAAEPETRVIVLRLPEDDEELALLALMDSEFASGPADILVEVLAPDRVRIIEVCRQLYPRVHFGDEIRVRELGDGLFIWQDTLARPPMTRLTYSGFPAGFFDRPSVRRMLDRILKSGGDWELTFGSHLEVVLPEESDFLPTFSAWFGRLVEREGFEYHWSETELARPGQRLEPGIAAVKWLFERQLQVDEQWSVRWSDGFVWWADQHAQSIEVVGTGLAPDGTSGDLVQIRTEVASNVDLDDGIVEALQAAFMSHASLAGPVYDAGRRSISLCSLVRVHEDIREWLSPILSMAAMLQISEAEALGRKLSERFGVEASLRGHPENGPRPEPDELAIAVPARLISMGRDASRWEPGEFHSTLDRVRALAPAFGDPHFVQAAVAEPESLMVAFPFADEISVLRLCSNRPHPKYGNGLQFTQSFPLEGLTAAEGARLALALNQRYLVEEVVGYGIGSFCYFNDMVHFTSFFPNAMYGVSLLQNLCFAALGRAEVLGTYLLDLKT